MTGTTTSNVNELIQLMNYQQNLLRYNSLIETDINQHGGTVVYSYNNIIMASDISEELYNELQKNPYIDYIQDLPLKKFGQIDINLINQLDVNTLNSYSGDIILNTGFTYDGVDGVSGKTKKSLQQNLDNNVSVGVSPGIPPTITNTGLTLTVPANEWFSYELFANGSTSLTFEIISPTNYNGTLFLKNANIISGQTNSEGIYNIIVRVSNSYGSDTKNLVLTISNAVKITNTNLQVYSKIGTQFSYTIEAIGTEPKTYSVTNLPTGFTLNNNIISGIFMSGNTYNMGIAVSNLTTSDSKDLVIISGYPPVFTSPGQEIIAQYADYIYQMTSNPSGVTYKIIGILPEGLQFNGEIISGIPTIAGTYELAMKATNPFGEGSRDLIITVYQ